MTLNEQVWNAERELRASTLRRTYLVFIIAMVLYLPVTGVLAPLEPLWYSAIVALLVALLIGRWVVRKGFVNLGAFGLIAALFGAILYFIALVGLTPVQIMSLVLCSVLSGTLLGREGAIATTVAGSATVFAATIAHQNGILAYHDQGPWVTALTVVGELIVIGILLYWNAVGSHSILTGLVRTATTLNVAERRYTELVDNLADGVVVVTAEGEIAAANPAIERICGYPASELIGRRFWKLPFLAPNAAGQVRTHFGNLLKGEPFSVVSVEIEARDGTPRFLRAAPRLLRRKDGAIEVCATVRDVTDEVAGERERGLLEAELQEARRLEALGRLAGGVAHDFNNWLTLIMANAALLRVEVGDYTEIDEIRDAAERSSGLTRQLLTFARRQPTAPQWVAVAPAINGVLPMLQRLVGHVKIVTEIDTPSGVLIDASQFEQVIMNLVLNAAEAMPDGGKITVLASTEQSPEGPMVSIDVIDEGNGIDDDVVGRLFEPFCTTKDDGTGLGLATVHGIVTDANGSIRVAETGPDGTRFQVSLPVHEPVPVSPPSEPRADLVVLLVDDDAAVRRTVERVLARDFDVVAVASAEEALEHLDSVDVVVSDIVMPGMSGIDLLEHARKRFPKLRFVLMSGYASDSDIERARAADAFIGKPFLPEALREAVRGHD